MKEVIINYLPEFLLTIGAGFSGWFFNRKSKSVELKKAKEELEASKSTNIENNLTIYQKMIDDIDERSRKRIDELITQIDILNKRYSELELEFHLYKQKHP